jgi:hypothetical protein
VYKNIFLVVLYGCRTSFLTLRVESRSGVFENRVLRRIFRHKSEEIQEAEKYCIMRSFVTCIKLRLHPGS